MGLQETFGVTVPQVLPAPPIEYLDFAVEKHPTKRQELSECSAPELEEVRDYCSPALGWIDEAVAKGSGVLIHCRAGAHRAGTTGVMYLMHARSLGVEEALRVVQQVRPAVKPHEIKSFPRLLAKAE